MLKSAPIYPHPTLTVYASAIEIGKFNLFFGESTIVSGDTECQNIYNSRHQLEKLF